MSHLTPNHKTHWKISFEFQRPEIQPRQVRSIAKRLCSIFDLGFYFSFKYGLDEWFPKYLLPFPVVCNLETWFATGLDGMGEEGPIALEDSCFLHPRGQRERSSEWWASTSVFKHFFPRQHATWVQGMTTSEADEYRGMTVFYTK